MGVRLGHPGSPAGQWEEAGLGVKRKSLQEEVVDQGSPVPRRRTGTGPCPVRNWAAQQ